jgi:hypothetical protein
MTINTVFLIWFIILVVCGIGAFLLGHWSVKEDYFIKTPLVPDSRDSLANFKREMKYWNRP